MPPSRLRGTSRARRPAKRLQTARVFIPPRVDKQRPRTRRGGMASRGREEWSGPESHEHQRQSATTLPQAYPRARPPVTGNPQRPRKKAVPCVKRPTLDAGPSPRAGGRSGSTGARAVVRARRPRASLDLHDHRALAAPHEASGACPSRRCARCARPTRAASISRHSSIAWALPTRARSIVASIVRSPSSRASSLSQRNVSSSIISTASISLLALPSRQSARPAPHAPPCNLRSRCRFPRNGAESTERAYIAASARRAPPRSRSTDSSIPTCFCASGACSPRG